MNIWFSTLLVCLALCAPCRLGAAGSLAAEDPAGKAIAEIKTLSSVLVTLGNDPVMRKLPREELLSLAHASAELTVPLCEKFLRDFPDDPRRWEAIEALVAARRDFAGPDADERRGAWHRRRAELVTQVLTDPAVPNGVLIAVARMEVRAATSEAQSADLERARTAIIALRERAPDASSRAMIERAFLDALQRTEPAEALTEARRLAHEGNAAVAELAGNWIASVEFKTKPLDLKFPDLDGREIDLSTYRGKVVLLDFWATWCAPCMAEMPKLRTLYEKYHARGFEIIGITDDIPPRDPANPRRAEKTVATLKAFLDQHNIPWPQLWDTRSRGVGPKGLFQQFGIRSLPTYLLFDQNGRFVTDDLRGEKLEAELQRLLDK